jgi:hypothetical protein
VDGSGFAPTLPEFIAAAREYRPVSSTRALSGIGGSYDDSDVSEQVRQFAYYSEYENWRKAQKGKAPPSHPTPDSADWRYLHRLAIQQCHANHARNGKDFG